MLVSAAFQVIVLVFVAFDFSCSEYFCGLLGFDFNRSGYNYSYNATKSTSDLERIEAEYIKNLQQQVYFLELETNYLYPLFYQ